MKGDTLREYKRSWIAARRKVKKRIAVLDFETDPFSKSKNDVYPFCGEIWDGKNSIVIWEEDFEKFAAAITDALASLSPEFNWTVYAHNGGKFDYMYLLKFLRGQVSFKGRGIMAAKIHDHVELRDSMHILPAPLREYKKDDFEYGMLVKNRRNKNKKAILEYLHSDCVYLYDLVSHFVERHGIKLSIGQAALGILKSYYEIDSLGEAADELLRQWYYGGRVECLQGAGKFEGDYAVYDVNSMYPAVMAFCHHPVSSDFSIRDGRGSHVPIYDSTVFLEVRCKNYGALLARAEDGSLTANISKGVFKCTIWEFEVAKKLDLIRDIRVLKCVDFRRREAFPNFSIPLYENRQRLKQQIDEINNTGGNSNLTDELERELLVEKFLLNNGYGKLAQNPRNFREYYYTDYDSAPPGELVDIFKFRDDDGGIWEADSELYGEFRVWKKPVQQWRFNNVATAASITGAARAKLLEKIHTSHDVIYCDTDSVFARYDPSYHSTNDLGAWKLEKRFNEAIILGKKLYTYNGPDLKSPTIRSKGGRGLDWKDFEDMLYGRNVIKLNQAPHFDKTGHQSYMERTFSMTCPRGYRSRIFSA